MAVVVGEDEDEGAGKDVVRLVPLTLWRRNADMEKMVEAWDAEGKVVVVDVGMVEDVGEREEEMVYRQTRQILPCYRRRRPIGGKEQDHMLSVSQCRYPLRQYTTYSTPSTRHDGKL